MFWKTLLKRLQSPVTIMATSALVYFIIKVWFNYEIPDWERFISLLIAALLELGVLNNPGDRKAF